MFDEMPEKLKLVWVGAGREFHALYKPVYIRVHHWIYEGMAN